MVERQASVVVEERHAELTVEEGSNFLDAFRLMSTPQLGREITYWQDVAAAAPDVVDVQLMLRLIGHVLREREGAA